MAARATLQLPRRWQGEGEGGREKTNRTCWKRCCMQVLSLRIHVYSCCPTFKEFYTVHDIVYYANSTVYMHAPYPMYL